MKVWVSGAATLPAFGCVVSGDAAWTWVKGERARAVVVDATGHGVRAAEACERLSASGVVGEPAERVQLLRRMHEVLAGTVGAAALVADVQQVPRGAVLRYAGVGNVRLWTQHAIRVPKTGRPGQLGHRLPRVIADHEVLLGGSECVFIATDGVRSSVLETEEVTTPVSAPLALAKSLLHHHQNGLDDATIALICPCPGSP